MTYPLGADSERLRSPAFEPFVTHMRDARGRVMDGAGPPTTVRARANIDNVVNQVVPQGWEMLLAVVEGFVLLSHGDTKQVQDLAALIEAAEAANVDTATDVFGSHHGHV